MHERYVEKAQKADESVPKTLRHDAGPQAINQLKKYVEDAHNQIWRVFTREDIKTQAELVDTIIQPF
jgi:hypothetical protein